MIADREIIEKVGLEVADDYWLRLNRLRHCDYCGGNFTGYSRCIRTINWTKVWHDECVTKLKQYREACGETTGLVQGELL